MTRRERLQAILDGTDPRFGRPVGFLIQVLILVSVVSITISTLPDLHPDFVQFLIIEELVIVGAFLIEYCLRVYAAPVRRKYIFSFYGLVDLASVLPALLLLGYDLRALRVMRVFRVLSLFKLIRYVNAFNRLANAMRKVLDELLVFLFTAAVLLYLCSTAIYLFEHEAQPEAFASIPHAMWWAVVTFTTVGYGDVVPITAGGRLFTSVMLVLALGIVAVPTGLIATALTEERREEQERREERERLDAAKQKAKEENRPVSRD